MDLVIWAVILWESGESLLGFSHSEGPGLLGSPGQGWSPWAAGALCLGLSSRSLDLRSGQHGSRACHFPRTLGSGWALPVSIRPVHHSLYGPSVVTCAC